MFTWALVFLACFDYFSGCAFPSGLLLGVLLLMSEADTWDIRRKHGDSDSVSGE